MGEDVPKRLIVTGSRNYKNKLHLETTLMKVVHGLIEVHGPGPVTLVSGNCPTGADHLAEELWERMGWPIERHPAEIVDGNFTDAKRSKEVASLGADALVAFGPLNTRFSKFLVSDAGAEGIPIIPNGSS